MTDIKDRSAPDGAIRPPTGLGAIRGLGYVFLLVEDMEKMRAFYSHLFGLRIEEEMPGVMVEFRVGSTFLGLRRRGRVYDGPKIPAQSASVQLSFRVPPDDVDRAHETLKAQGVDVIEQPTNQHWTHRTLYFRDPENNVLEIFADISVRETLSAPSGVHACVDV